MLSGMLFNICQQSWLAAAAAYANNLKTVINDNYFKEVLQDDLIEDKNN